jgi:hypothetical protein
MFYKCAVRLGSKEEYKLKQSTLSHLQNQIDADSYCPNPHGFLSVPKGPLVTRFVPVFSYNDYSVYFGCVGCFDEQLSKMAVAGTFGGWSLGGSIRKKEEEWAKGIFQRSTAKKPLDSDVDLETISASMPASAYDPWAWVKHWNKYWILLTELHETSSEDSCFISLDIANFYDSIDLILLEQQLKKYCGKHDHAIHILFKFLKTWNAGLISSPYTTKGLPQDMVGDCSRLLANFYLVSFDADMKSECEKFGARYVRYADDMVIMCPNKSLQKQLMFFASRGLHRLGLNINTNKVRCFSKEEFDLWWGFNIMNNFERDLVLEALNQLKTAWDNPKYGRRDTALKRAITILGKQPEQKKWRRWANERAFQEEFFILRLSHSSMKNLIILDDAEKQIRRISKIVLSNPFTEPKVNLLRCLENFAKNPDQNVRKIVHSIVLELSKIEDPIIDLSLSTSPISQDMNISGIAKISSPLSKHEKIEKVVLPLRTHIVAE